MIDSELIRPGPHQGYASHSNLIFVDSEALDLSSLIFVAVSFIECMSAPFEGPVEL